MSDLISRQAAINAVGWYSCHSGDELLFADNVLKQLPSAEPERHGRWIDITNDESLAIELKCSECGFELINWLKMHYCPNCGAKMVGEQDG